MRKLLSGLISLSLISSLIAAQSAGAATQAPTVTTVASDSAEQVVRAALAELDQDLVAAKPGRASSQNVRPRGEVKAGKIKWRRCADDRTQQCATFAVPKNWNKPRKGKKNKVFLSMRRIPTTARGVKRPSLFVNPGGPGGSGAQMLVTYKDFYKMLQPYYNIVSWDPRGVIDSTPQPRSCPHDPYITTPSTGPFQWTKMYAARYNGGVKPLRECIKRNAKMAQWIGTNAVVRDLDAMRKAVGDKKLSFQGISYGTRIGRTYQLTFPKRVRVMILDGVVNPSNGQSQEARNGYYDASRGWRMLWKALPTGVRSVYKQVNSYLQSRTIKMPDSETVDRVDFWSSAINTARKPVTLKTLPVIICTTGAAIGATDPACARYVPGSAQGRSMVAQVISRLSAEVNPAVTQMVNCSDGGRQLSRSAGGNWVSRTAKYGGPEAATDVMNYLSMCPGIKKGWDPVPALNKRTRVPKPPLIVNGIGDIATFYGGARQTRDRFIGSRLVTVNTTVHGLSIVRGNKCVDRIAVKYLRTTKLPKRNLKCGKFPLNPFAP